MEVETMEVEVEMMEVVGDGGGDDGGDMQWRWRRSMDGEGVDGGVDDGCVDDG